MELYFYHAYMVGYDFQYCKWVFNFLHYFFNVLQQHFETSISSTAFYSILLRNTFEIV